MYEKFVLKDSAEYLQGYLWESDKVDCVVCLVHGIGEHAGRYDRIGETFKSVNIALISMDLRGHGYSFGKRGHTAPREKVFKDIDLLLTYAEKRFEQVPMILYGHSMGGNLVLDYRRRGQYAYKPKAYLITSPWVLLVREIPTYLYYGVKLMARILPTWQMKTKVPMEGNKAVISRETNKELMHGRISLQTAVDAFETGEALLEGRLENTTGQPLKPMLLMHGDADKTCSPEGSRRIAALENGLCQYLEWQGYYHELHNGKAEEDGTAVIEAMVRWIKGL